MTSVAFIDRTAPDGSRAEGVGEERRGLATARLVHRGAYNEEQTCRIISQLSNFRPFTATVRMVRAAPAVASVPFQTTPNYPRTPP